MSFIEEIHVCVCVCVCVVAPYVFTIWQLDLEV